MIKEKLLMAIDDIPSRKNVFKFSGVNIKLGKNSGTVWLSRVIEGSNLETSFAPVMPRTFPSLSGL